MSSDTGGKATSNPTPGNPQPNPQSAPDLPNRQAVVIIHGIGEQVPMATLRGFVNSVWVTDEDLIDAEKRDGDTGEKPRRRNPIWTKPDRRNRSFELRRITTERDKMGVRTDFYEFYWAHLMHGTTLQQVWAWIAALFLRPYHKVPSDVVLAWLFGWALTLGFLAIAGLIYFLKPEWWASIMAALGIAVVATGLGLARSAIRGTLVNVAGDVVRYVEAKPTNVARRQEIREQGVQLLETLMGIDPESLAANEKRVEEGEQPVWKPKYRRIVVVGHSLGSIVGYDLLKHTFARVHKHPLMQKRPQPARRRLETYCRLTCNNSRWTFNQDTFRRLQRAAFEELREHGSPWVISDFVTLGAALTHLEFLMAEDTHDAHRQQFERILPTCPPTMEWDRHTHKDHFSYRTKFDGFDGDGAKAREGKRSDRAHFRYPHHAAHFAFTRWTNLHSPSHKVLWGDLVSGPISEQFGLRDRRTSGPDAAVLPGAKDVKVLDHKGDEGTPKATFTHLDYWNLNAMQQPGIPPRPRWLTNGDRIPDKHVPHHIRELRKALDLLFKEDKPKRDDDLFR
ncbi:MAG: hypothetical protein AAGK01_04360 [Pseudomonadota bacterium]